MGLRPFTKEERRVLGSALSYFIASATADYEDTDMAARGREVKIARRLAAEIAEGRR